VEVEIAKRIERGHLVSMKALSRSPVVVHHVLGIGEELKRGRRSIKEIVVFDEEEITEDILRDRVKGIVRRIDHLHNNYNRALRLTERLVVLRADKKTRQYRRCRSLLSREIVQISLVIRDLGLTPSERKRLMERVNKTMENMRLLNRNLSNLGK
jgi:RNA polymerase primary sigma factor